MVQVYKVREHVTLALGKLIPKVCCLLLVVWLVPSSAMDVVWADEVTEGRILFTRINIQTSTIVQSSIYIMNADGSEKTNLTVGIEGLNGAASWSPDGSQIVFVSDRDGNGWQIFTMDVDGNQATRLTDGSGEDFFPQWSPDGKHIAYIANFNSGPSIRLMNADGSNDRELTSGNWPSWTPDGRRLLITVGADWTKGHLAMIDVETKAITDLEIDIPNASESTLSPDGEQIVFVSNVGSYEDPLEKWNEELWLVNIDGSGLKRLTTMEGNDHWPPSWSPDGKHIVFSHDIPGTREGDIYVIDVESGELTNLSAAPDDKYYNGFPAWQP